MADTQHARLRASRFGQGKHSVLALQIPIAPLPLRPDDRLRRLTNCGLVVDLHHLLPVGASTASNPHRTHGLEQVPLYHEPIEALDALLRIDLVQHDMGA
jgi:hypothetical protein